MSSRLVLISLLVLIFGCIPGGYDGGLARAKDQSLGMVFRSINPAVVEIAVVRSQESPGEPGTRHILGSGLVISEDGRIVTSAHLVNTADSIMVRFLDGETFSADIVSTAAQADVALLQLSTVPLNLTAATLGDSDTAEVGDRVMIIGAPYGISHTMTAGYIGGRRQSQTPCSGMTPFEFLQTDAAINKGNSGGPMVDMQGRVIGIVSRIFSSSGGSEGLGFAVAVNTVKKLLLEGESSWIGFEATLISGDMAAALNVPQDSGLLVQKVARNSPAFGMGLQPGRIQVSVGGKEILLGGDIILEIQGLAIQSLPSNICTVSNIVGGFNSDNRIEMTVLRKGKRLHLSNGP